MAASESQTLKTDSSITQGYAQVNGVRLHYAETGTDHADLILLLHGFPEFWYSWRHQLPVLANRYHAVAPDMRGYNLSDKPSRVEGYAMDVLVADVIGLIDYFGVHKASIVGHDWGAGVAWAVAQKYPERVASLTVMQVPPAAAWRANMTLRQLLRSWYMFFFQLPKLPEWAISRKNLSGIDRTFREMVVTKGAFTDQDIELYKEAMSKPGALTAAVNYYRANVGRVLFRRTKEKGTKEDNRIQVPTLFIFAEKDFAIIPETVRGLERYVKGLYREVRIPDSGHWVQNEAVKEVNRVLLEYLDECLVR